MLQSNSDATCIHLGGLLGLLFTVNDKPAYLLLINLCIVLANRKNVHWLCPSLIGAFMQVSDSPFPLDVT